MDAQVNRVLALADAAKTPEQAQEAAATIMSLADVLPEQEAFNALVRMAKKFA